MKRILQSFSVFMLCGIVIASPAFSQDAGNPPSNDNGPHHGFGGVNIDPDKMQQMKEKYQNASPDERKQMREDFKKDNPEAFDRMQKFRDEIKNMPPEEREARIKQKREEFEQKWNSSSPEMKQKFCQHITDRCSSGGKMACTIAHDKCGGR